MILIKQAVKYFKHYKIYSSISLVGLILGLLCTIVLFEYISFERSFDTFHTDADRIFRVNNKSISTNRKSISPNNWIPVGPALKNEFPHIVSFNRLRADGDLSIRSDNNLLKIKGTVYADSNFFNFFSFGLLLGDPHTALVKRSSIVLSEKTAIELFGSIDLVGRTVQIDDQEFTISAIAANVPQNSHIQFGAIIPISNKINAPGTYIGWHGGLTASTFIKLNMAEQAVDLAADLPDFLWEKVNKMEEGSGFFTEFYLENICDIHLFSIADWDSFDTADLRNIRILSIIGMIILLMACFNYFILSKGLMVFRQREFSVKKCLGSGSSIIIKQVATETIGIFVSSLVIALILKYTLSDFLSTLFANTNNFIAEIKSIEFYLLYLLASIIIALIISFFISKTFSGKLKGNFRLGSLMIPKIKTRIGFISGIQFCIVIILISSILIIQKQFNYLLNKDLGFEKQNIVHLNYPSTQNTKSALRNEIQKLSGVKNVCASYGIPGLEATRNGYRPEGREQWLMLTALHVDDNFFKTYGMELIAGRDFVKGNSTDDDAYIINETLARQLGWEDPIGKTIYRDGNHRVIGIVKDFHTASLYHEIPPLIISKEFQSMFYSLSVAIHSDQMKQTLADIESVWTEIQPNVPFNYFFLDSKFEKIYSRVESIRNTLSLFAFLAIAIASLGLLGISLIFINIKTKEIGIRKVNGARSFEILSLLNKQLMLWMTLAFILACPISFILIDKWLENFAYKTSISWWSFGLAGTTALIIALLTISLQSWKAASRNPVEVLRYE